MAQFTTTTTQEGLFKEVYGEQIKVIPDIGKMLKIIPFSEGERIGKHFVEQMVLTHEGGISEAAAGDGAFDLLTSVAMATEKAEIDGAQILIRGNLDYESIHKATEKGPKAMRSATQTVVENLTESINSRLEWNMLYGRSEIGITSSAAATSGTVTTVTFTAASWSDGAWAGKEGHQVAFYDSAGTNLVSSGADAVFVVGNVDNDARTVAFTGTSTGSTALVSDIGSAAQYVYWLGSTGPNSSGHPPSTNGLKSMVGLNKIITTSSGTLFGLPVGDYSLLRGNQYSCSSGPLTLKKILGGLALPQARAGLVGETMTLFCSPITWNNIASDQAAFRRYGAERGKADNGFEAIQFHSASGPVEIIGHPFVKRGEAFAFPAKRMKRIGSTDITFKTPGERGMSQIFHPVANKAGVELRAYTMQSIFCEQPAKLVKYHTIVND